MARGRRHSIGRADRDDHHNPSFRVATQRCGVGSVSRRRVSQSESGAVWCCLLRSDAAMGRDGVGQQNKSNGYCNAAGRDQSEVAGTSIMDESECNRLCGQLQGDEFVLAVSKSLKRVLLPRAEPSSTAKIISG